MKRTAFALALSAALTLPAAGRAAILTQCGASDGVSYFLQGSLVPSGSGGWTLDGIGNGRILLLNSTEGVDIVWTDATGTRSARADGAALASIPGIPGKTMVLAIYPTTATVQTYIFSLDGAGRGSVVWTSSRAGGPVQRVLAMSADCTGP